MNLHRPRRPTLSGLGAAAIAAVAAAVLACAGCGGSSTPNTGTSGAQGSGTSTAHAQGSTKPAAPRTTAPAAPAAGSVSLKDIVVGNGNACKAVSASLISAAIGPITSTSNPQGLDTCEWLSASSVATLAAATRDYYPTALTDTYSNPVLQNGTPLNPCPGDPSSVYGTSSSQYVAGAFCNVGGYEFQVVIGPADDTSNNGQAQIGGVFTITKAVADANS